MSIPTKERRRAKMISKKNLAASLMLSSLVLTTFAPVVSGTAATTSESSQSSVSKSSQTSNKSTSSSVDKSDEEATAKTDTSETETTSSDTVTSENDKIQTLTEQTMVLKKIIAKPGSAKSVTGTAGINSDDFKGVNGSTFTVYDVTDLMNTILEEKLKVDDHVDADDKTITDTVKDVEATSESSTPTSSSSSQKSSESNQSSRISQSKDVESSSTESSASQSNESSKTDEADDELAQKINDMIKNDTVRKEVADRAAKLDQSQLKKIATVKTTHDKKLNSDGVAKVKLPIDGKYHAYYVVNTETPEKDYVTNSAPIVVLTPVTDDEGMYAESFTVFPKSDNIDRPKTNQPKQSLKKVTSTPMYQTGVVQEKGIVEKVVSAIWNWF